MKYNDISNKVAVIRFIIDIFKEKKFHHIIIFSVIIKMDQKMNKFLNENSVNPSHLSDKVLRSLSFEKDVIENEKSIVGGFIKKLTRAFESSEYKAEGGTGTVLPSEYFGNSSASYFTNVTSTVISDASPIVTRPALPSSFKGGAKPRNAIRFVSVGQLKNIYKNANKVHAKATNLLIEDMLKKSIIGGTITQKSLKNVFR